MREGVFQLCLFLTKLSMNAFALMKKDHKKVAELFEELIQTTSRAVKKREELFHELKKEIDAHAKMEEAVYYPAIKERKETHDIALEAYEEHHVVKLLLGELDKLPKDREEWIAKLSVLKENVEHHVEEEEGEMFRESEKLFSTADAELLGEKMEEAKVRYLKKITESTREHNF